MATKEQRLARLERIHARGFRSYVVRYGVIGWGVSTAIVFAVVMALRSDDRNFFSLLGMSLILFPLGGIAWGSVMWWFLDNEWKRRRHDPA